MLDHAKVPQQWKLAEITPVYKKGCMSKVFERLDKFVFAYRKFHGCDTALLRLNENWRKELENHKKTCLSLNGFIKSI